jgi:hypothetical protein
MRAFAANDPLPYRPIRIVDVSPFRSTVRRKPAAPGAATQPRWVRVASAMLLGVALAVIVAVVTVGAASAGVPGEFRLAPGHAMPSAVAVDAVTKLDADPAVAAFEFRLGPGHAIPAVLAR